MRLRGMTLRVGGIVIDAWGGTWGGNGEGRSRGPADADRLLRMLLHAAERSGPGVGERVGELDLLEILAESEAESVLRARRLRDGLDAVVHLRPAATAAWRRSLEARRAAIIELQDPRLLPILAVGESPGGVVWCAREVAVGRGLVRWCRESAANLEGRLSLLGGLAAAIAGLHAAGVPHGELNEGSVLVHDQGGGPRLRVAPLQTIPTGIESRPLAEGVADPFIADLTAIAGLATRALAGDADPVEAPSARGVPLPWRIGRELRRLLPPATAGQGSVASLAAAISRRMGGEVASE